MDACNPGYYHADDLGIECIDLTEQYTFNVGNCLKYMFRLHGKNTVTENLDKARYYAHRARLRGERCQPVMPNGTHDAAHMIHTLARHDWQHAAPFWTAVLACHMGEADTAAVAATLDELHDTL